MENLARIKFDTNRGGSTGHDFVRTCICLGNWPSDDVEIWSSDDNGQSWDKLDSTDYLFSYDGPSSKLYVSFLTDFTSDVILAFFCIGGQTVGAGFTLLKHQVFQTGWMTEGHSDSVVQTEWNTGAETVNSAWAGYTELGDMASETGTGYTIKSPRIVLTQAGFSTAAPSDKPGGMGYTIGTVGSTQSQAGYTVMGLNEFPVDVLPIDESTKELLTAEYGVGRQKIVTLNGTTPEVLD